MRNVTFDILYIPVVGSDIVERSLYWKKSAGVNSDYKIPNSETFNSSDIFVQVNFEYTEQIFKISYTGVVDIMAKIGGLSASVLPILRILGPWLILWFLCSLCNIIIETHKKEYNDNLIKFI
jgi:hypothetical protein